MHVNKTVLEVDYKTGAVTLTKPFLRSELVSIARADNVFISHQANLAQLLFCLHLIAELRKRIKQVSAREKRHANEVIEDLRRLENRVKALEGKNDKLEETIAYPPFTEEEKERAQDDLDAGQFCERDEH